MDHVGREQVIHGLGRTWTVGRWDRGVWAEMFRFARSVLPNPIEEAAKVIEKLPQPAAEMLLRTALDKASSYLSVSSPEMRSLLSSVEGNTHLLWLLLRKEQPDVTEEQAYELFMANQDTIEQVFLLAAGKSPKGNAEAPSA